MYGVDGRHELTEAILSHWEGYKGSGPVRIGNHAYQQTQVSNTPFFAWMGTLLHSMY